MTSDQRFWIQICSGAALTLAGIGGGVYTAKTQAQESRRAAQCDLAVKAALALPRPTSDDAPLRTPAQRTLDDELRSRAARCLRSDP